MAILTPDGYDRTVAALGALHLTAGPEDYDEVWREFDLPVPAPPFQAARQAMQKIRFAS
ncbi:hypothetical protein ACFWYW_14485 [Nonomuraea sp. NPDC059023]|uniref:hypothetical protein n=1 Tax=unclassified Nonomuraea TaxID=2593643 RepID=UPI0036A6C5EA